ncbi:MAG: ABC transporter permease [Armatimonadota bacterium]|nr:ABC transporter permease [Armatimonadota bacterium]
MEERTLQAQALERRPTVQAAGGRMQAASVARSAFPLVWLGAWEMAARLGWMDARFFPPPSLIFETLVRGLGSGELVPHLGATLARLGVGFVIGAVPAALLGILMGLSPWVRAALDPVVAALYPIPKSALLPLLLLIFGLGEGSKLTMSAIGVFFVMVVNAMEGVLVTGRVYFDVARSFSATRWQLIRTVALPGALPLIMAGARLGIGLSLILVVLAEMLGARNGLGYVLWSSWQTFSVPTLYAVLMITALLGYLSVLAVDALRKILVPWQ